MFKSAKAMLEKSREIDRGMGKYAEKFSRFLWPWREQWLLLVVVILAILDFASTYILLELSHRNDVYESGLLAIWALDRGGFSYLLLVDIIAAVVLSLAALIARHLYTQKGYPGYGRAALVFLLAPYIFIALFAIVNNIILLFH
jgi:hypothetical protein